MKNLLRLLGIIALVAAIGFNLAGCGGGDDGGSNTTNTPPPPSSTTPDLKGTISIYSGTNPATIVVAPATLTAVYTGSETVGFQWNKDGAAISGATTVTYTVNTAGSYTVTATAGGYNPKTSGAVTVTVDSTHNWQGGGDGWGSPIAATAITDGYKERYCSGSGASHPAHYEREYLEYAKGTQGFKYEAFTNGGVTEYRLIEVPPKEDLTGTDVDGENGVETGNDEENGVVYIAAYWRPDTSTSYNDYRLVTEIKANTFEGRESVTKIEFLPGSQLRSIGDDAFDSTGLKEIEIPASVTTIGIDAFENCTKLTTVTFLGNRLGIISDQLFYGCEELTGIKIPTSVTTIGISAFNGAKALKVIDIPALVTSIGATAFQGCETLSTVTYSWNPACAVTIIGQEAFSGCKDLTGMIIHPSVRTIGAKAFDGCVAFSNIEIPSTVTAVGDSAFNSWGSGTATQKIVVRKVSAAAANTAWNKGTDEWDKGVILIADPPKAGATIEYVAP